MDERIIDMKCSEFIGALGSSAPIPGGGGAAALCGAISAALCAMVGNITASKKEEAAELAASANQLAERFLLLVDADAEGFKPLSDIYSMPKDTPNYDELKRAAVIKACEAPMEMIRLTTASITILEQMKPFASKLLISDIGCGAVLATAALKSASMNIFVNTRLLKMDAVAQSYAGMTQMYLSQYLPKAKALEKEAFAYLRD